MPACQFSNRSGGRAIKLQEVGEFGLIELLARELGPSVDDPRLIAGIGDDAMAWREGTEVLLATTDALVEDVHFRLGTTSWQDLGWKALAVNLSDIAAMGGRPDYALVTLGLNERVQVEDAQALYRGIRALAERTGCAVVGGDVVNSPHSVIIGVTVLGRTLRGPGGPLPPLLRSAAAVGDIVAVAGWLGASAAGLWLLSHPEAQSRGKAPAQQQALRAHLRPEPLLVEAQHLALAGVRAGMDVSDGLLADLEKLCRASGVAARIDLDALPVQPAVRQAFGEQAVAWALSGGEDYALLVTLPPERFAAAAAGLAQAGLEPLQRIGNIHAGPPGEVAVAGLEDIGKDCTTWSQKGWDHFAVGERGAQS